MFFYCTSKINNYYKVGIAGSISRIKKRLTNYRSANPRTTIKLFSELGDPYNIEWSFKNKFKRFRIGKSECYNLRFDIIYKHFLKYQHKNNCLHQFWDYNELFLSEYYFNKQVPDHEYNLTERQQGECIFDGFIPVASLNKSNEQVEKDKFKFKIIYLDINKVDLKEYKLKFKKHLKEKWYGQQRWFANSELEKFYKENFKLKKIVKSENIRDVRWPISEIIFKDFEKKYKNLVKKYPPDEGTDRYYERSDQKSIVGVRSFKLMDKIQREFEELHDQNQIIEGIQKLLIRRGNHPLNYLPILYSILSTTSHRAPKEIRVSLDKLESEVMGLIQKYQNMEKINDELNQQKRKIAPEKNVINFMKNVSKYKKNK